MALHQIKDYKSPLKKQRITWITDEARKDDVK